MLLYISRKYCTKEIEHNWKVNIMGSDYRKISLLKSKLFDKNFQTWLLFGWQHGRQWIRSLVWPFRVNCVYCRPGRGGRYPWWVQCACGHDFRHPQMVAPKCKGRSFTARSSLGMFKAVKVITFIVKRDDQAVSVTKLLSQCGTQRWTIPRANQNAHDRVTWCQQIRQYFNHFSVFCMMKGSVIGWPDNGLKL